ncbi:MAG: hypothetical protein U9R74_07630 [Pseudomonadota bacterium]|nr:hypothetical protein [Pseudomonadota bacterium]
MSCFATVTACSLSQGVKDDTELVSAEPGERVGLAQTALQRLGKLTQQRIARRMSAAVIDDLESVKIEKQHRRLTPGGLAKCQALVEPALELETVQQTRERIVGRLIAQFWCCESCPGPWPIHRY